MKKIIKQVTNDIVQITICDERWYVKNDKFVPSVTWIAGHYPKGIHFYKWLAQKGWDEAEAIKQAAGDKGSKVHNAIVNLLAGEEVKMEDKYINNTTEKEEELSLEEYEALFSFVDWFKETKPLVLANEIVAFNGKLNYAGTVDLVCKIGNDFWIIDFKTGQNIWPEYELQISAYKHALKIKGVSKVKLGVLQLGYKRNKKSFKFTEVEDKFDLFLSAKKIWANENEGVEPKKKDYPLSLILPKNETNNNDTNQKAKRNQVRPKRKVRASVQRKAKRLA
jgi:hypothetical protein